MKIMKHKILSLITALAIGASGSWAFNPGIYASQSKLASGKWVKVRTTAEGIYQFTYDQLKEMGFADPSKVQVYGYGAAALTAQNSAFNADFPDDIQPVATRHSADGRILFFGQGDAYVRSANSSSYDSSETFLTRARNTFDTASYYFLSDCEGVAQIPSHASTSATSVNTLASHIHVDFIEEELQSCAHGGNIFHGKSHAAGDTAPYTFQIKNFAPTALWDSGSFFYKYAINSESAVTLSVDIPSALTRTDRKDNALGNKDDLVAFKDSKGYVRFTYPNAPSGVSENMTFSVTVPSANMRYCAEDYVVLRYPRANRLDDTTPFLVINFPEGENGPGQSVEFDNTADGSLEVWSIDGTVPLSFPVEFSGNSARFVLDRTVGAAVAFNPAATFASPEVVGDVAPQNIHGAATPDMVIITVPEQMAQARQLAELHKQYQGMDVLVADHNDIFNEFSSGARDAMAYRRMAKMFYDRDPGKFRFLMLMGPSSYDNRCIAIDRIDRIISFEQDDPSRANNVVLNYAMDTYFAMLEDNYDHKKMHLTPMSINVGRLSSINTGKAATYVEKVRERFENPMPQNVQNRTLIMADVGNSTAHSTQCNEVIQAVRKVNPAMAYTPVYAEMYPSTDLTFYRAATQSALQQGVGMMTYIGHGSATAIKGWGISQATGTNYAYSPFVMFSSCDQFAFDHNANGLMDALLFKENGGALGGVAAVRSVYVEFNQYTCVPINVAFAGAKPGDTFGDVLRNSRDMSLAELSPMESIDFYKQALLNMLSYNLAGDPAIPLDVATCRAEITSVNGSAEADRGECAPLEKTVFAGQITKNGTLHTDFNGTVRIDVFDGAHTTKTNNLTNEADYVPATVNFDSEVLATVFGEVKAGKFSVEATLPAPAFPTGSYRTMVTASSDSDEALGLYDKLSIADFDPSKIEDGQFDSPQIIAMYAGDSSFQPGDEVSASCTIHADIYPSNSGINTMSGNVSTRTRLTVDGKSPVSNIEGYISRSDDGNLHLAVPMSEISEGSHRIELCVVNNAGLVTRESIEIVASQRSLNPRLAIAETPASEQATISLDGIATPEFCRLLITDASGNPVLSAENPSFPYEWNLKDSANKDVADGLYNVSVLVQNGRDYGSTPRTQIIVLR